MSELLKRAITGAAYVALTLGAAWIGQRTTLLLFAPACALGAREFHRLIHRDLNDRMEEGLMVAGCTLLYIALALVPIVPEWPVAAALAVSLAIITVHVWRSLRNSDDTRMRTLAEQVLALVYVAVPFGLITWLLPNGPEPFIGFMLLLWTSDTGAYIAGRTLGRTKLLPAVSPKKTVEGLIGGVILTLAVGWMLAQRWHDLSAVQWMAAAVVTAAMATLGDLLESALKRARGVKDSGNVLPGHGGILDRFDGFLLALPAMLLVIHLTAGY